MQFSKVDPKFENDLQISSDVGVIERYDEKNRSLVQVIQKNKKRARNTSEKK